MHLVLDHGFLDCQEIMGNELTVVNSARVSFGKQKNGIGEEDTRLLRYLIRNKHFSPFRHIMFRFHIKAPEFVMRQWYKHVVGAEWSASSFAPFHAWNEISGRYVPLTEFYQPESWRSQSTSSKQGSGDLLDSDTQESCTHVYNEFLETMNRTYELLLEKGVAKEQARSVLPLSVYTEAIWTCSFQSAMNFLELRLDKHAQWEIREYATVLQKILNEKLPLLMSIWKDEKTGGGSDL